MAFPFDGAVVYDFEAQNEGEMSVKVGDEVTVTSEAEGGWYVCTNSSGVQGYVPVSFLDAKSSRREGVVAGDGASVEDDDGKGEKSAGKKRSTRKQLDGESRTKSTSEKPTKKKEKSKDAMGEPKKLKKSKKAAKENGDSSPPTPEDSSSTSQPSTTSTQDAVPETSASPSSRPKRTFARASSALQAPETTTSPSPAQTPSNPTSPGSPREGITRPVPPTNSMPPPTSTTPKMAGTSSPVKLPVAGPPIPTSPNAGLKKAPPAIPQKPTTPMDALRGTPKQGMFATLSLSSPNLSFLFFSLPPNLSQAGGLAAPLFSITPLPPPSPIVNFSTKLTPSIMFMCFLVCAVHRASSA